MNNAQVRRSTAKARRPRRAAKRPPLEVRRTPQQKRSRERVDAIVEAARRLIGQRGSDAVSMREIAAAARVPIASVYQYFPDKTAILRRLMEGYLETLRGQLFGIFGRVQRPAQLEPATLQAFAIFERIFLDEPALKAIWSGALANAALSELDAEDTRINAEFFSSVLERVLPQIDADELRGVALFAVHMAGSTVRLAHSSDAATAKRLLEEMNQIARLRLAELIERQRAADKRQRSAS